ncbi:MAG: diguanylate cyclase (GGDEF)-like protein [Flavobacteriales bacterium]|jgi:diguanylate cyclase (GGDEF)-like protein
MQARLAFKTVIFFIPLIFMCLSMTATALGDLQFKRLLFGDDDANNNDALTAIRVTIQDPGGFIWFAGENGLGRYDGHDITIYQTDPDNPRSLTGNFIWALIVDNDGVMWVGGGRGLNRYNKNTDDFDRFVHDPTSNSLSNNNVNSLAIDQNNNLIIATDHGLNILNADRTRFYAYYYSAQRTAQHATQTENTMTQEVDGGTEANLIREVFVDSKDQIWVGTHEHGLNLFDRNNKTFAAYVHDPEDPLSILDNDVSAIEEDYLGRIWVGGHSGGLNRMNPANGTFTRFPHNAADATSIPSNNIADIFEDSRKNLWIAADHGGLALYKQETDSFQRFTHKPYDDTSLSSNNPRHVYEDNQGNLWVGMFPTGVNFLDQSAAVFANFAHKPDDPNSLSNSSLLCIFEDSDAMLWIGTEGGMNKYDRKTKTFTRYLADPEDPSALRHEAVLSIEEDISGDLWVGTWSGGLHRFDKKTEKFHRYFPDENNPGSISNEFIWKILKDRDGVIWVATQTGGLNRYDRETDSFTRYKADTSNPDSIVSDQLWTIMEDSKGYLWIGTMHGLDRYDKDQGVFTHYQHDSSDDNSIGGNVVVAVHEDSRGVIWVATRDAGISILNSETQDFIRMGTREGLPSSGVSSIIEDDEGNIWATTANGIVKINPLSLTTKTYQHSNGLISNYFNRDATFKDDKGRLYVGGIDGMSIFDPADITSDSEPAPVVVTQFRIFNQPITIGGKDGLLSKSITETDKLLLSYKHAMFSFELAVLSYRSPKANKLAYMLEGFDKDWIMIGNQRTATYTNIDPGKYIFRVKGATRDGIWNEIGTSIAIEITPPPWKTGWAYLAYLLIFSCVVYIGNAYKTLRVKTNIYRTLSSTDRLTGINNRTAIDHVSDDMFSALQIQRGVGLLVIDIDHFKKINDVHGHDTGDRILKEFSHLISLNVRSGDTFARWGGEEFILLCANIGQNDVINLAEKILHIIASHEFEKDYSTLRLTVSIGIAFGQADDDFDKAFKRADIALYEAKTSGRNQISVEASLRHTD